MRAVFDRGNTVVNLLCPFVAKLPSSLFSLSSFVYCLLPYLFLSLVSRKWKYQMTRWPAWLTRITDSSSLQTTVHTLKSTNTHSIVKLSNHTQRLLYNIVVTPFPPFTILWYSELQKQSQKENARFDAPAPPNFPCSCCVCGIVHQPRYN